MKDTATESRVAATTCTGEVTVALLVGEHMVTEGEAGPAVHATGVGLGVGVGVGDGVPVR
jgi:hypothetical protein